MGSSFAGIAKSGEGSLVYGVNTNRGLQITIVIPTLNEVEGIRKTIQRIPVKELREAGYDVEIIVVDGGSKDGTDKIAREMGAVVVYEPRRGYGRAYKAGFSVAKGDVIVTLDGDGSYPSEAIPQLLKLMSNLSLDFIVVRRVPHVGAMDFINNIGNCLLTLLVRILFRVNLRDSQSGMWVIKRDVLRDILPRSNGMEFSEEIKIKAFLCGKRIYEYPLPYYKRVGRPKLKRLRDGLRNLIHLFIIYVYSRMGRKCYE